MHAADCEPFVEKSYGFSTALSRAVGMPPPGWGMLLAMGAMGYFWDFLRRRARQAPRARRVTVLVTT